MHGLWEYCKVGWAELYSPIEKIDTLNNTIKITNKSDSKRVSSTVIGNNRNWCGINILAELDIPRAYYIDREHKRLYVYPPENIDFQSAEIMLSMLGENGESIIEASGLKNVAFRNIVFEKSRFGALTISDGVENCHIHHFGLWNRTYAQGIKISGVGTIVRNCKLNDAPHSAPFSTAFPSLAGLMDEGYQKAKDLIC